MYPIELLYTGYQPPNLAIPLGTFKITHTQNTRYLSQENSRILSQAILKICRYELLRGFWETHIGV
jgi:hypothetical protein